MKRLLGRTPDKLKAKALAFAERGDWMDARIACNEALEGLPEVSPERGELEQLLSRANEAIARDHLDADAAVLRDGQPLGVALVHDRAVGAVVGGPGDSQGDRRCDLGGCVLGLVARRLEVHH
ncbi:MAG: hypothetical protein CME06_12790, partial [Gemmatimonadetes bacterium]|nr:hypothetical protein [Gemmatimonadota bacterium]